MRKIIIMLTFTLIAVVSVYAVETTKPETHTTAWERSHGNAAKANEADCLSCHEERLECIACHEDMAPRNHTASWVRQNHGLESRWNRTACATCHKEDFCSACHEEAMPRSHQGVWVDKKHGQESYIKKVVCDTCHKESTCTSCHETTPPQDHARAGFRNGTGSHCGTSCQLPAGSWSNTPFRRCLTCHKTRPIISTTGQPHAIR